MAVSAAVTVLSMRIISSSSAAVAICSACCEAASGRRLPGAMNLVEEVLDAGNHTVASYSFSAAA
jgi:hypothetical protein